MKKHYKILQLFAILILMASCVNTTDDTNVELTTPTKQFKDDNYSFEYEGLNAQEYITFNLKNDTLKGTLFLYDEYFGEVFYKIRGTIFNDSLFIGSITTETDDLDLDWSMVYYGDSLLVDCTDDAFPFYNDEITMLRINSTDIPNKEDYGSVEDIETEMEAEASENMPPVCFHKYYPSAASGRHTTQKEYLKIWFRGDYIYGVGAGYSEGDPDWSLDFEGTTTDNLTYSITASYQCGEDSYSTTEVWSISPDQVEVSIMEISPNDYRSPGIVPFHQIDCDHIDDWALKLMNQ